jgi:hypothetical protein
VAAGLLVIVVIERRGPARVAGDPEPVGDLPLTD